VKRGKRLSSAASLARASLGLLLAPFSLAVLFAACAAFARLAARPGASAWFLAGFVGYAVLYAANVARLRPLYVLAHETTHALAAWMGGGKVFAISVKGESGHVDLSHSSPFVALAPYWVPLYALLSVLVYRLLLWSGPPPHAREAFLALMGAALSFHLMHTAESLWVTRQGDLEEAGTTLSLSLILLLNGLLLLAALTCLFPRTVSFGGELARAAGWAASFWRLLASGGEALVRVLRSAAR
jgi:hypothetical protein